MFALSFEALTGSFPGGVMIYGKNSKKGLAFGQKVLSGSSQKFELDNGEWSFYAVGWDATPTFSGSVLCGSASAVLNGADTTVDLAITSSGCDAKFTDSSYLVSDVVQPLKVYTCSHLSGLSASSDCENQIGGHRSLEVVLKSYVGSAVKTEDLRSSCVSADLQTISLMPADFQFLLGTSVFNLHSEIHAYAASGCTGAKEIYRFPSGLSQGPAEGSALLLDGAGEVTKLFLLSTMESLAPAMPIALVMASANPINSFNATVNVTGVSVGSTVMVYADSNCTTLVGSAGYTAYSTAVPITLNTQGNTTLFASQTKNALTSACSSASVTVLVDLVTPTPASSISWTQLLTSGTTATLNWIPGMDGLSGVLEQHLSLYSDITCTTLVKPSTTLSASTVSHTFPDLADGTYYAKIKTVDSALNSTPVCFSTPVVRDSVPPAPATGLSWATTSPTTQNTFEANWTLTGDSQSLLLYSQPNCAGSPVDYPLGAVTSVNLTKPEGTYSYQIVSRDLALNSATSACSPNMVVDQTPPPASATLTLISPASSPGNTATPVISVSGVEIGAFVSIHTNTTCTAENTNFGSAAASSFPVTLIALPTNATYTFSVRQRDAAGNSSCSNTGLSYTYDSIPPVTPSVLGVKGGDDVTLNNSLASGTIATFGWNDVAGEAKYKISIWNDSNNLNVCPDEFPLSDATSFTFQDCSLTRGLNYTFRISAIDAAENSSTTENYSFTVQSASWVTIASGPSFRAATAVWTGTEMILWGGKTELGAVTNNGREYNPSTNTWTAFSPPGGLQGREKHTAVWTGTQMIIFGGENSGTYRGNGGRYNPGANNWTEMPQVDAPNYRSGHAAVWDNINNRMLVFGGRNNGGFLNSLLAYRPDTDQWQTLSPTGATPSARQGMAYAVVGQYFLVWGGVGVSGMLGDGARLDMSTNTWSAMSPSPLSARSKMAYTKVGNNLMIWGGDDGSYLQDGALYDPETDTWKAISTTGAPAGRAQAFMAATNSEVLVWGGDTGVSPLSTGGLYHPETDTWSTTFTNSPSARTELSGVSIGDEIIIHGGFDGTDLLSTGARIKP